MQWDILRTAFHQHRTLVLIGDPKQAIYRFRGADVATYLRARADATTQTLHRNWRADPAVLDGLAPILSGTALGDPRITVRPIEPARTGRRLRGGPAVRVRQVTRDRAEGRRTTRRPRPSARVRDFVHADVAAQVLRTLREEQIADGDGWRPVQPGDIAVLTRVNAHAVAVQRALASAGVPAVISMLSSVFDTPSARDWLVLLSALARPGVRGFVSAAALTPFVGWTATELAEATDEQPRPAHRPAAVRGRACSTTTASPPCSRRPPPRACASGSSRLPDGERRLTDVRHVGEALHVAATRDGLGAAALLEWLRGRVDEAGQRLHRGAQPPPRDRHGGRAGHHRPREQGAAVPGRARAVPVGPVRAADARRPSATTATTSRCLHVGGKGSPGYDEAATAGAAADAGEGLRLAYVALTRATSQVVAWWAPSANSVRGAADPAAARRSRRRRQARRAGQDDHRREDDGGAARARRRRVRARGGDVRLGDRRPGRRPPSAGRATCAPRGSAVGPDVAWRRTSYSALTAAAHDAGARRLRAGVAGSPGRAGRRRRRARRDVPDRAGGRAARVAVADGRPAGRHAVRHARPPGARAGRHRRAGPRRRAAPPSAPRARRARDVADALLPALRTPARPAGARPLARRHRPARPPRRARLRAPARRRRHPRSSRRPDRSATSPACCARTCAADDPFAPYADRLDDGSLSAARLRGYLTGSIDAVLRVPRRTGGHRYLVVDYKTNRLGAFDEPLSLWHYRPEATRAAMMDAHYPLQLLLYSAALHRYLRWRLPAYDPAEHLGGGLYLFLRGMAGPSHARRSTASRSASCRGGRRPRSSSPCPTCWREPLMSAARRPRAPRPSRGGSTGLLAPFVAAELLAAADVHVARRLGRDRRRARRARPARRGARGRGAARRVGLRRARRRRRGRLPWPRSTAGTPRSAAARSSPTARTAPPTARCAGSTAASTSTATGATSRRSARRSRVGRTGQRGPCRARRGHRPPVPAAGDDAQRDGAPHRRDVPPHGPDRRPGHGQDHDGRPPGRRAAGRRRTRACASRSPPRPARPPPACRSRSTRRSPRLDAADRAAVGDLQAMTIHRLLGRRRDSTTRFRHDRQHRLPHDVVIVDESSMVSLPLMARLTDALRPTARLVLVGDPDQLASVEAGAVLGDLVAALPRGRRPPHPRPPLRRRAGRPRRGDPRAATPTRTLALLRSGDAHRAWSSRVGRPPRPAGRRGPARGRRDDGRAL